MCNDDFINFDGESFLKGKPTHTVVQVIECEGKIYRYQIGKAEVEGQLDGVVRMDTMFGDLEVVSSIPGEYPPFHIMAEQMQASLIDNLH